MTYLKQLSTEGQQEIATLIIDAINDDRIDSIEDMHHEIFNTDYFIVYRDLAKKWLEDNYGIFEAIDTIKQYEEFNFGEVTTDLSEPERVCNMLVYILGEEMLNDFFDYSEDLEQLPTIVEDIEEQYNL